jgi:hypothetical protein
MIVAGSASPLLLASAAGGYNLTRSLRFRASASAYLNRTPATASNRRTFTFSTWLKRGNYGSGGSQIIINADNNGANYGDAVYFSSGNILAFYTDGGVVSFSGTSAVFRDSSAWYHIVCAVDTTQATDTNRVKIYVNGVQQTLTGTYPSLNYQTFFNSVIRHQIANSEFANSYFDGYMAEVNFIDGQALTPSSFGENNEDTGVWQPIKYAGTYGTNGFYLPFSDNASTTTLGSDFSGNGNNWTTNNISLTAGSTYDSMTDVPTLTSATASNYCVFNPLDTGSTNFTLSNGNLNIVGASASSAVRATVAVSSGKWYWEATPTAIGNGLSVGFAGDSSRFNVATWNAGTYVIYQSDGNKHINGSTSSYGASYTTNDVIGIALDMDAGTITFYKNNTSQGVATTGLTGVYLPVFAQTSGATTGTINANFGAGSGFTYTPPTGFVALNTFNLPTPTIGATATTQANQYMDINLYTGNSTARSIVNSGGFEPAWVWIKNRSGNNSHRLFDIVRGATKALASNSTSDEFTESDALTAFNSNGFSLGNDVSSGGVNTTGDSLVAWQWNGGASTVTNTSGSISSQVRANTSAGFSVVTYTGTGSNATFGHGLGVTPKMFIIKSKSTVDSWVVWQTTFTSTQYLLLNSTNAVDTAAGYFNSTLPNSTVISLGNDTRVNGNGTTYVAYCFSEVAGYSKFGSYTGNGSADGTFVYTGFRPRYVMMKNTGGSASWYVLDSARNTYNLANTVLNPNSTQTDTTISSIDMLSNGFKLRGTTTDINGSGTTYIYACFAENPFKYSLAR